jgi:hypothetical protein
MQCNIDGTGQKVRRIWGGLCVAAAIACGVCAFLFDMWWLYVVGGVVLGLGIFSFWEAQKKWCVMRAMGVKTKY